MRVSRILSITQHSTGYQEDKATLSQTKPRQALYIKGTGNLFIGSLNFHRALNYPLKNAKPDILPS